MMPLALVNDGEKAEIVDFIKKGKYLFCHLRDMELITGKIVEVINNQKHAAIVLKIDESRLAIGRCMAMKIMVRRKLMSLSDFLLALCVFVLAVYILYRSLWKKKGRCSGCRVSRGKTKDKILL